MDHSAHFQFFGRLQNLLVRPHQAGGVAYAFNEHPAIKDAVEALGIPHTEVAVLVVNGASVSFAYRLQETDHVDVYPHGWPTGFSSVVALTPALLTERRFILDVHLGKLARRLRILGFDCLYQNDYEDEEIVEIASNEERIVLTRDRGLLKRKQVVWGCLLDGDRFPEQLCEVDARYDLIGRVQPLGRCPTCNGLLQSVEKEQIVDRLEPKTIRYYDSFRHCSDCDKIYWRGSQAEKLLQWVETFRGGQSELNPSKGSLKS